MALVGDVILGARELFTDPCSQLGNPTITGLAATTDPDGTLTPDTYTIQITYHNAFGETNSSSAMSIIVDSGSNAIAISHNAPYGNTGLVRVYVKRTAAAGYGYSDFVFPGSPFNLKVADENLLPAGYPPNRNSAYLPDTDGPAVSAFAIYRWLSDGLKLAASANNGGLPDFAAVNTVSGQPLYTIPGQWKKVDNCWYDGYPVFLGRKNDIFRKNKVTGWSATVDAFQISDQVTVEVWPQPSRTAVQTTLSNSISATDTSMTIASTAFNLPFGMVMVDSEIMAFANISGSQITGLKRGMSGTRAVAHSSSAPVLELNLMISGYRVPSTYSAGDSAINLPLPPGWEHALETYLLHRFKKAEQQMKEAKQLLDEFTATMQQLVANAQVLGPRQIQVNAGRGVETYPGMGSPFGGVIVP